MSTVPAAAQDAGLSHTVPATPVVFEALYEPCRPAGRLRWAPTGCSSADSHLLVHQAVLRFGLFTGQDPPVAVMRAAGARISRGRLPEGRVIVDPGAVALGVLGCGAANLLVPALIRRVPRPETRPEPSRKPAAARQRSTRSPARSRRPEPEADRPRPTYAAVADRPRLALRCAAVGTVAGGPGRSGPVGLAWPLLFLLPLVRSGSLSPSSTCTRGCCPSWSMWPTFGGVVLLGREGALLSSEPDDLVRGLLGAVGVFVFFYVLWWVPPPGWGSGTTTFSAVLGFALAYLGWPRLLHQRVRRLPGVLGARALLVAVLRRGQVLRVAYPFGPFLLGGALAGGGAGGRGLEPSRRRVRVNPTVRVRGTLAPCCAG